MTRFYMNCDLSSDEYGWTFRHEEDYKRTDGEIELHAEYVSSSSEMYSLDSVVEITDEEYHMIEEKFQINGEDPSELIENIMQDAKVRQGVA